MNMNYRARQALAVLIANSVLAVTAALDAKEFIGTNNAAWLHELLESQANRRAVGDSSFEHTWALTAASKPVVWNTNVLSGGVVRQRRKEFMERQYLEGYRVRGKPAGTDAALAVRLITNWIAHSTSTGLEPFNPRTGWSEELAQNPDQDPLVLTVAGANSITLEQATNRLERAVKGFEDSKHKAFPKFHATVSLAARFERLDTNRVAALDAIGRERLEELLTDGSVGPGEQGELAEVLVNGWGQSFVTRNAALLPAIVRRAGTSFEWLTLIIEGESHIKLAWQARGCGYADTVTPEGWRGFEEHLAKARPCFTRACELRPDLPLAAYRMMVVALGSSDIREIRQWFDATVAAQPDYAEAWREMLWALRPRWYGDHESMLAFGITAANTKHYETDIPRFLLASIEDVESEVDLPAGKHICNRADLWPHLQGLYEGYLAEPSHRSDGYRLWSEFAVVAYLAEQYDVARQLMDKLRWNPWEVPVRQWNVDREAMVRDVRLHTAAITAESRRNQGDKETQTLIRNQEKVAEVEASLKRGGWLNFLPTTDDLAGWKAPLGKWRRETSGAITAEPEFRGHMLYSRAPVGREVEVMGSFEVVQNPNNAFQAGLVIGLPSDEPHGWYGVRLRHSGKEGDSVCVSAAWVEPEIVQPITLNPNTNSFYIRFQKGTFTVTVNGREICKNLPAPRTKGVSPPEFFIGLGARDELSEAVIRYNSLKVRKLNPQ